ncbi:MAG TPA: RDD family protein [Candidatus Sulfopaludibacter sp.]|nr:RDD family protein [Candidatus Sulfopaludibacter sp.]
MAQLEIPERPRSNASVNLANPYQRPLFQDRASTNVIPFESFAPPPPAPAKRKSPARSSQRRVSKVVEGQGSLDFLPAAPVKPRTLGTTVDSVIYCEAPVATTAHRAVAAALDWAMVLIAYGAFLATYRLLGGEFAFDKLNGMIFGGALLLIAMTYGLFFTIANSETAGMHWTHLKLTTFDGFPPDLRQRIIRFAGSCLSLCTVVGLLWSLVDEESLTWQDHISSTFPTPRALDSQIFRRV